jgi:lipopolysaccharide transport system permease protein
MTEQLSELWRYRELFYFLAWRDVKIRYKQTVFGAAWAVLQPLLSMAIFLLLFYQFAKLPTDGIPPALFYYSALVPWIYFSGTLSLCGNSLLSNVNLLTKVYFPRCILPAAVALGGLVDFAISGVLIGGFLIYYRVTPDLRVLLLLPLTLLLVALTCGLGMFLSAVAVKYRDVKYATPFLIQVGFFATPIFWPIDIVPERYRALLFLNPLVGIIDSFRSALIPSRAIPWGMLAGSAVITAVIVIVSAIYFRRSERLFADWA